MTQSAPIIYDSKPNPERYPDRLRVIAALRGIAAAPFSRCRVLDVGCGTGLDLIHQAVLAPDSFFSGFDISEQHLAFGEKLIRTLELKNVILQKADIASFRHTGEPFDYIVCHGVFSWVSPQIQEHIFRICEKHLAPSGIACVTFNALPGWQSRETVRKLLAQTDLPHHEPMERVAKARETMEHALQRLKDAQTTHSQSIQAELTACLQQSPAFIFHELLAETNQAFYFDDFIALARRFKLQYLGDGRPSRMRVLAGGLEDQNLRSSLSLSTCPIETEEQIWDLILPSSLRACLLCHESLPVARQPEFSHVFDMHIASRLVPLAEEPRLSDSSIEIFCDSREYNLEVQAPALKSALTVLARRWPAALSVQELLQTAADLSGELPDSGTGSQSLLEQLGEYFFMNLIDLYFDPPVIAAALPERPKVFELARAQAAAGLAWVSNPRFEFVPIGQLEMHLLPLLDGSRSAEDCLTALLPLFESGSLEFHSEDAADRPLQSILQEQIEISLKLYFESALIVP